MSDQTITSLIEKLEGAEVGSRELDCAVARVLDCYKGFATEHLTTSLDAALALAERICPRFSVTVVKYRTNDGEFKPSGEASLLNPYGNITEHRGKAATPALALCAAILRAQSEARV